MSSASLGHMSVKLRSRDELVIQLGEQTAVIRVCHARRGEARLVVSAPASISIQTRKRTEPTQ